MTRWFRFYDEALDDPKVQRLPGELFKTWVNLLCIASRNDGLLPPVDDLAFALRLDPAETAKRVTELWQRGLIDEEDGVAQPHNWRQRQFRSDHDPTAAQRQARKRERDRATHNAKIVTAGHAEKPMRDASRTVTRDITPPRTETDTDTDPEQQKPRGRAPDLEALGGRLLAAAGWRHDQIPDGMKTLSPILRLIEAGCDLELDILPTVHRLAGREKARPKTWSYFDEAIIEARDTRLRPVPEVGQVVPGQGPPRPRSRADDDMERQRAILAQIEAAAAEGDAA